jgi:hypothetical protein
VLVEDQVHHQGQVRIRFAGRGVRTRHRLLTGGHEGAQQHGQGHGREEGHQVAPGQPADAAGAEEGQGHAQVVGVEPLGLDVGDAHHEQPQDRRPQQPAAAGQGQAGGQSREAEQQAGRQALGLAIGGRNGRPVGCAEPV